MQLTIKYFGMLAEVTQCQEETLTFDLQTVSDLVNALWVKYPLLKEKDFQVAQNCKIVNPKEIIKATEIALLPPFAGG